MDRILTTISTDRVNLYGYRIAVSGLEDALFQNCIEGVPSNFNHDVCQPIGWSLSLGLYFEPKLTRWIGHIFIPQTNEEKKVVKNLRKQAFARRHYEACQPHLPSFQPLIEEHFDGSESFYDFGCVCCVQKDIVQKVFPELLAHSDKKGLIYLTSLLEDFTYVGRGVFKHNHRGLAIFAHHFFRRSLSRHNTFHWRFLDELLSLKDLPELTIRLGIDNDVIGYAPSIGHIEELDYWHGGKFNDDITSIKSGITHHESNDRQRRLSGISRTEFYWKRDDSGCVFEAEELKDFPTCGEKGKDYGCRYVHAIFDPESNYFNHFDGAIRVYDEEKMLERLEQKFTHAGRNSAYTKVFRLDGALPLHQWKSLICNYFQGNPLIEEYFEIADEGKHKRLIDEEATPSTPKALIPYSMQAGQGIRLLVSYHAPRKNVKYQRVIAAYDEICIGNEKFNSIEYDVIELRKALQRLGEDLPIPKKVLLTKPQDLYWNIPMIFHGGKHPSEALHSTIKALLEVCHFLVKGDVDMVLTSTWSLNAFEREVRISILGHVKDVANWLSANQYITLLSREEFKDWLEGQAAMQEDFPPDHRDFDDAQIIKADGVLYLTRVPLSDDIPFVLDKNEKGLTFNITFPKEWEWAADAMERKEIKPVISYNITKGICERTGQDYLQSPYSRLAGETHLRVQQGKLTGVHWTDRPYLW